MISSINVKQIEHQLGIKAKLVATGIIDYENSNNTELLYLLNNALEYGKLYLVKRYDGGYAGYYHALFYHYPNSMENIMNMYDLAEENVIGASMSTADDKKFYIFVISGEMNFADDDYIEFYELPIILGGEE